VATGVPSTRAITKVFLTIALLAALLYLLWRIHSVLTLIVISVFLAVALGPPVDFLARRVRRSVAILGIYLVAFLIIVGIGLLVVPPVVSQVQGLAKNLPGYLRDLRKSKTFRKYDNRFGITKKLEQQAKTLPSKLGTAVSTLQSVTVGVFGAFVKLLTVLTMTFLLLLDGRRLTGFALGLMGPREPRFRLIAGDIYKSVSGYVAGNLAISVVAGLVTFTTLEILGVPFAVPLAVLVGFLDLIPLVGATLGSIAVGIVTAFTDFPTATIVWVAVTVIYQQVENNLLQPIVYRQTVNVPPLAVIIAVLIGGQLLGVLGALLAIPVAAIIQIILRDLWRRRGGSDPSLTPGDPLTPESPSVRPPPDEPDEGGAPQQASSPGPHPPPRGPEEAPAT
jgi:predicted PurR-regulated permease PerM